jgi:hypothetical protein
MSRDSTTPGRPRRTAGRCWPAATIVGQNVLAAAADKRSEATYNDADAVLHEAVMIQEHLLAQDKVLESLVSKVGARQA